MIKRLFVFPVVAAYCLWASVAYADELLDKAQRLINEKQSAAAYTLLSAAVTERAGTPEYDLLLGIAALDSGKPTQAVFALERVLSVQPDNARARAELARAYFEAGENEAAKQEFSEVKDKPLPPTVAGTIDKYLSAIDARLGSKKRPFSIYADVSSGYDSNVNSATDSSTVAIPAFGNLEFTIDDTGRELNSGFVSLGAGAAFSAPIPDREDFQVYGNGYINERYTFDETDFRTRIFNGQLGLRYNRSDNDAFMVGLLGQKFQIDQDTNRDQTGVNLQWLHVYDARTQLSLFAQWAAQRFPDQDIRNVNQFTGGVGAVHALDMEGEPIIFFSLFGGTDDELNDTRQDLGRSFVGVRAGGQYSLNDQILLVGNINYQYSDYGADDPLFLKTRTDHFVYLRAGVEYSFNQYWTVVPELQYTNNNSNIVINEYDRWQALVNIRFKF